MRVFVAPFFVVILALWLTACSAPEAPPQVNYDGPLSEGENVEMFYTEKGVMKMKMNAKKVWEFQSGDREFPEGIYLEFYDETGQISSTLRANYAYYYKAEDKWKGQGNVQVKNIAKDDQLNTEELFWKPDTKRIFTEKFFTIRQKGDLIYGTNLDAAQDLSNYTFKNPEADFLVEEEPN